MKKDTDYILLYRIAHAYYCQGQTQEQIARRENISRPHVSRLLVKAQECGVVSIHVELPDHAKRYLLGTRLCEALHLQTVLIAPIAEEKDQKSISRMIAQTAAEALPELLSDSHAVGVGWGYTVFETAEMLEGSTDGKPRFFVPLVGITGEDDPYLQINLIVNRFAERFDGRSKFTSVPAIRESSVEMDHIAQGNYQRLQHQWEKLDAAIIGLGGRPGNGMRVLSEGSEEYHRVVEQSDVVGDILAHFFFRDGTLLDTSEYYEQTSLRPQAFRNINTVICVAGGEEKVDGLLVAAQNGFYNILITDPETAQAMLNRLEM